MIQGEYDDDVFQQNLLIPFNGMGIAYFAI